MTEPGTTREQARGERRLQTSANTMLATGTIIIGASTLGACTLILALVIAIWPPNPPLPSSETIGALILAAAAFSAVILLTLFVRRGEREIASLWLDRIEPRPR